MTGVHDSRIVGIDAGSVSVNCVVINTDKEIVYEHPYTRHFGQVQQTVEDILRDVRQQCGAECSDHIGFTGNYGNLLARQYQGFFVLESIAQILGTIFILPDCRSIISMGGQDTAVYQIRHHQDGWDLTSFNTNGPCATGTGSFLDQQAQRLATSLYEDHKAETNIEAVLDDFIALGLKSQNPAHVACRCTVFTKSDMIHLQNKGEPLENIIYGLHVGNARNYMSTIINNRVLEEPIAFIGGLTLNQLQVKSLKQYYPSLFVPPYKTSLGALGAAIHFLNETGQQEACQGSQLETASQAGPSRQTQIPRTSKLTLEWSHFPKDNLVARSTPQKNQEVLIGIDIGSTTTKSAVISKDTKAILHKKYLPTQGKPIQVTQTLLQDIRRHLGWDIQILGLATTGSGRSVVGDFLQADLVIDEITAHATGAVEIHQEVDTIFEIGGQDSKYIALQNTYPLDFDMNKVCSAGTGSFLHELANKFDINIVNEFQDVALSSSAPVKLSERCTVFMESDLVAYDQMGVPKQDLMAGLCYAVVLNYLNRVVGKRRIGNQIMFLGGPSLNKAVVAAFESLLDCKIMIPRHREVMGAFGAAVKLREKQAVASAQVSTFRGIEQVVADEMEHTEMTCRVDPDCHNQCKLKDYNFSGRKSIWGGECGRYETVRHVSGKAENFFRIRDRIWEKHLGDLLNLSTDKERPAGWSGRVTVGIPRALFVFQSAVLWSSFFKELGLQVVLSPKTNPRIVQEGIESMRAETCFPIKVAHGHVQALKSQTDFLFLPTLINMETPRPEESGFYCPLVQSFQYMARQALELEPDRLLNPVLHMKLPREKLFLELQAALSKKLKCSKKQLRQALDKALDRQALFEQELYAAGESFFASLDSDNEPVVLVTGRPYNLYDDRINLKIGQNLAKIGLKALPMDFLNTSHFDLSDFPSMYWGLGAQILRTARFISKQKACYGLHISNFSCGADSFLEHFYKYIMGDKPYLLLELDEHSSAAGIMTRLEAFQNVIEAHHGKQKDEWIEESLEARRLELNHVSC